MPTEDRLAWQQQAPDRQTQICNSSGFLMENEEFLVKVEKLESGNLVV